MQLRADKDGFLVGDPIELKDLLREVGTITAELSEIKELLRNSRGISISKGSINSIGKELKTGITGGLKGLKASNDDGKYPKIVGNDPQPKIKDQTTKKIEKTEATEKNNKSTVIVTPTAESNKIDKVTKKITDKIDRRNNSLSKEGINKPKSRISGDKEIPVRGADGRFISKGESSSDAKKNDIERGANGQFVKKNRSSDDTGNYSKDDKDGVGTKIKNVGKNIVDGLGEIVGGQPDNSDPSLQAVNEIKNVFTPVGRGLGKIFTVGTGGVSRGQDRWYRRFFKQNADKNRVDDVADKRQRTLLTGIYRKSGTTVKNNHGYLATILLSVLGFLAMALLKGFKNLMLPFALLGKLFSPLLRPLIKVLSTIAKMLGLNRIFGGVAGRDRLGSPIPAGGKNGKNAPVPVPNGKNSKKPTSKTNPTVFSGAKDGAKNLPKNGAVRGIAKKIPFLGALITAGFLANDIDNIQKSDELSKREKREKTGGAVGASAGGIGGMLAGASLGATVGSVVPIAGNIVGAVIGGVLGAIGGDFLGEIIGEKIGGWTDTLINSDIGSKMVYAWDVGVETMRLMWNDFTQLASERWDAVTQAISTTWDFFSSLAMASWGRITNAFDATTDFMQKTWTATTGLMSATLGLVSSRMTELGKSIASNVKQYTGLDLGKHVNTLKSTVGGWVDTLKTTVKDVSSDLKSKLSTSVNSLKVGVQGLLTTTYIGQKINEATGNVERGSFSSNGVTLKSKEFGGYSKEQRRNQEWVLEALMEEGGLTKNQALAFTGQIGREGDFLSKNIFSTHQDAGKGKKQNYGMISWQGGREKDMIAELKANGLWKNGKMVESRESVGIQAKHIRRELQQDKRFNKIREFLDANPHLSPDEYEKIISEEYIVWARNQDKLADGTKFNKGFHFRKIKHYQDISEQLVGNIEIDERKDRRLPALDGSDDEFSSLNHNAEVEPEPNSVEGMIKRMGSFDGMNQVKTALVDMIKFSNEGGQVKHAKVRSKPVVSASSMLQKGAEVAPAPQVQQPISNSGKNDSNASIEDVSREVSDQRIAHIVTGAYSSKT